MSPKRTGRLREAIRETFGLDMEKTRPVSASSTMDGGTAEIPPEGSPIPFPGGRTPDATADDIARGGGDVTGPRTLEQRVADDLYLPADGDPDPLMPGGVPEPGTRGPEGGDGSVGAARRVLQDFAEVPVYLKKNARADARHLRT